MGEWLYYNFAAGSFHTKKLCSKLYSIEIEFYLKTKKQNKKSLFEPPFGDLGVVDCPFVAIGRFSLFRYVRRLRRYKRKSVEVGVIEGGGPL